VGVSCTPAVSGARWSSDPSTRLGEGRVFEIQHAEPVDSPWMRSPWTVFIGIILGCVCCPIVVKQAKLERNKAAGGGGGGGSGLAPQRNGTQFSRLNVETLPLTQQQQQQQQQRQQQQQEADRADLFTGRRPAVGTVAGTSAEGNPLMNARAVPPRPNPAEPFVSHHYTVLAPAVVRVGNTKFNKKTGNLTVGEQVGCLPLLARLTHAACTSHVPTCSSVSSSG
jgi:hypothetical protein